MGESDFEEISFEEGPYDGVSVHAIEDDGQGGQAGSAGEQENETGLWDIHFEEDEEGTLWAESFGPDTGEAVWGDLTDDPFSEERSPQSPRLVFAGYLEDGTPNYIWDLPEGAAAPVGFGGASLYLSDGESLTDGTYVPEIDISDPLSSGVAAVFAGEGSANYFATLPRRESWHASRGMSSEKEEGIPDGLTLLPDGRARIYKDGYYFLDGSVALDGVRYYADVDGYLVSGWMKTKVTGSDYPMDSMRGDAFSYRYCDPETFQLLSGYQVIDGIPHHFDRTSYFLNFDTSVMVDGSYYYCDLYGICSPVRLSYGNMIDGPLDTCNDAFLARNQVMAVDPDTYEGQDGEYSFHPRFLKGTSFVNVFGFEPLIASNGWYYPLLDENEKGKIGCIYRRVGKYKGRTVDLKMTVMDYEGFDFDGEEEVGYFYVFKTRIGVNCTNLRSITVNVEFLDNETRKKIPVKGYATFTDIDIGQSVEILSPVDAVYVSDDCVLLKDPERLRFSAPFIHPRIGSVVNDEDMPYWVQVNYDSDHLTYKFSCGYDAYVFADTNRAVNGESRQVFKSSYTGNVYDYMLGTENGTLLQTWLGMYYLRLGRVSLPPIFKYVSDGDEKLTDFNTLTSREEAFTYTLFHNVPGESPGYYYERYEVSDMVPDDLAVDPDSLSVFLDDGTDVTDRFQVTLDGQRVSFSARPSYLSSEDFYDQNYSYQIGVSIKPDADITPPAGGRYEIVNTCQVEIDRLGSTERKESTPVVTTVAEDIPGELWITKRIREEDIVYAHGNPTFLFAAEGQDSAGAYHRFETFLIFTPDNHTVDAEGFASLSAVISGVPLGSYDILELPVNDYYLYMVTADTDNASVIAESEPGRGLFERESVYARASLTREYPVAAATFYNQKGDYFGWKHTSIAVNNIPLE